MDFPKVLCLSSPEAEIAQVFQVWNICRSRFQQKTPPQKNNDLHSEIYLISHVMQ